MLSAGEERHRRAHHDVGEHEQNRRPMGSAESANSIDRGLRVGVDLPIVSEPRHIVGKRRHALIALRGLGSERARADGRERSRNARVSQTARRIALGHAVGQQKKQNGPQPVYVRPRVKLLNIPTRLFRRHETCGANDGASVGLGRRVRRTVDWTADS